MKRIILTVGLLAATSLMFGSLLALEDTTATGDAQPVPQRVRTFIAAKERQIRELAEKLQLDVPSEAVDYLKAARSGDWQGAMGMYTSVRDAVGQHEDDPDRRLLLAAAGACVLEVQIAFDQILETDVELAIELGDAILSSIPRGAIYFGGTDAGRGLPTTLSQSHQTGDPFFTVTQNALADGGYLRYLQEMYGSVISMPSTDDSQKAFQDYLRDAGRRLKHDEAFPNEPRQLKPGENVQVRGNRVNVSGQVAVMSINGRLAKTIFDRNPDREFYVEESFPLDWMHPHLTPAGLVMKLNREPVKSIRAEEVEKDQEHWQRQTKPLIGAWLKPDTSVDELCRQLRKVHVDRNLAGFTGSERYLQAHVVRKAYAKLRSAHAGMYAWHGRHAEDRATADRMNLAAESAFKLAIALCPDSAEAVTRYVDHLLSLQRSSDARKIAELAASLDPGSNEFARLTAKLSDSPSE